LNINECLWTLVNVNEQYWIWMNVYEKSERSYERSEKINVNVQNSIMTIMMLKTMKNVYDDVVIRTN
jgi:hypothetical protein